MSKAELRQRRIRSVPGSESVIVVIVEHKGGNEGWNAISISFIKNVKFYTFFVLCKQLHVITLQTNCGTFYHKQSYIK